MPDYSGAGIGNEPPLAPLALAPRAHVPVLRPARIEQLNAQRLATVQPELRAAWLSARDECEGSSWWPPGWHLLVTDAYRPPEEQAADYAKGRTVPGPDPDAEHPLGHPVTDAMPWQSPHQYRCAVDAAFVRPDGTVVWDRPLYDCCGPVFESHGLVWGGRFRRVDRPHCELPDWRRFRKRTR